MKTGRRKFVIGSGLLLLAGCQSSRQSTPTLPGAAWPSLEPSEVPHGEPVVANPAPPPVSLTQPMGRGSPDSPIPRSAWTRAGLSTRNAINPMKGINRITIHHEGWKVVGFDDYASTAARLDLIRRSHVNRKFADIGYHFIIDRAGRVYEGRSVQYQGAHVRDNNEHNLGIMCLGNFDQQQPTDAQLRSLAATVALFRKRYNISASRVFTHREIVSTACPGRNLQSRVASLRRSKAFG